MNDNRSESIFQNTTQTNTVNLAITTLCTMRCPLCTLDMPVLMQAKQAKHADVQDIERDLKLMAPLRRVHLTGGEPTIHPDFERIVKHAKDWAGCVYLTIETNGARFDRYADLFDAMFDKVFITRYEAGSMYDNSPGNSDIIERAAKLLGDRLIQEPAAVHSRAHEAGPIANPDDVEGEIVCSKAIKPGLPCSWFDGLLYSCCVTPGIDKSVGIRVTKDWRQRIVQRARGCALCAFRGT